MAVFDLRQQIVDDYASFARSFTRVRAADLRSQIDVIYANDQFWPEPLLQITPHYERGGSIDKLAAAGEVTAITAAIFRLPESPALPLELHTHQVQALTAAKQGRSYVVTTGTGSGKSLCFFIPIIDAILRAKEVDKTQRSLPSGGAVDAGAAGARDLVDRPAEGDLRRAAGLDRRGRGARPHGAVRWCPGDRRLAGQRVAGAARAPQPVDRAQARASLGSTAEQTGAVAV